MAVREHGAFYEIEFDWLLLGDLARVPAKPEIPNPEGDPAWTPSGASGPISAVLPRSGTVDLYWARPDGAIGTTFYWEGTGWHEGVETLTAAGSAVPGAVSALVPRPNTVDVYWVTPDGAVGTIAWFADSGWQAPYTVTPAGVAAPGAINALRHSDEVVLLYWIASDGSVASTYWYRAGKLARRRDAHRRRLCSSGRCQRARSASEHGRRVLGHP